jgi:hypothetical protein
MKESLKEMKDKLRSIGFFVGGLTDKGIEYHYERLVMMGKI